MIPTMLLMGFAIAPTPQQFTLAQRAQARADLETVGERQPDPQGPNALFLKYRMAPAAMDSLGRLSDEQREEARRQAQRDLERWKNMEENGKSNRQAVAEMTFGLVKMTVRKQHTRWKSTPPVQLLTLFLPIPPSWLK